MNVRRHFRLSIGKPSKEILVYFYSFLAVPFLILTASFYYVRTSAVMLTFICLVTAAELSSLAIYYEY